jgi:hypothetical protein
MMLPKADKKPLLHTSNHLDYIFSPSFVDMPQAQKHLGSGSNVATNASLRIKLLGYELTNTYPSTQYGMKVNIKGL